MAITEKQAKMVLHQEAITTSTLTPQASSARSLIVVLKQLHTLGGRLDEGALLANKETSPAGKLTTDPSVTSSRKISSMSLSAMAASDNSNQLSNWPAETTCKGITVTLDNNSMWNEFFRCQTEMILTKQGRRMFPCCRFRISGLEPFQRYTLVMDMHPVDNHRYRWSDRRWETNGKADLHIFRSFIHPDSPATGLDWMQNPVSFYKLKLTNNTLDQEGYIIINSMHRYLPRLHIIPADKTTDLQLNGPDVITFSFPQTEFFAVTAYQNLSITQLKIDYNPFAKGFREDATNSRSCKTKNGPSTETVESEVKPSREITTLNNLKSLFAKRNAAEKVLKGQNLLTPNNGDLKNVNCEPLPTAEPDKSSSKKRPWPGGLSELIKGAQVKVKRISLDKIHNSNGQTVDVCSLDAGEKKMDLATKDCKSENILVTAVAKEETKRKPEEEIGTTDVKQGDAEGSVSFSKTEDPSTMKNTTELSSQTTDMQNNPDKTLLDIFKNENMYTTLSETVTSLDENGRENPQSVVKPVDCGEVKKKRADPVPLPLLALFLQQLKSKTRPIKSKSETSSPSHTDKSSKTATAENEQPPTPSCITPLKNQSNSQDTAHSTSEPITPSISSCPVGSTTVSPSLLSTALSSTPATLHLHPTPMPVRCAPFLDITDKVQVPDHTLAAQQKSASTPDSVTSLASIANSPNIVLVPNPENVNYAIVQNSVPITATTPDANAASTVFPCAPSGLPQSCANEAFPTTTSDSPNDELVLKVTIPESTDPSSAPCPESAPPQPPLSGDATLSSPSHTPSSPDLSLPSPAPSSPDPFPPSLFSDRPIPPRKSLDPFPPCLTLDRPRPPLETPDVVRHSFFVTKPTSSGEQGPGIKNVSAEVPCPTLSLEPCVPKTTTQDSTSMKAKMKPRKSGKSKPSEDTDVPEGPIPVPMQPVLEDVEGQLFVSFMSKKALEIHLGDEAKEEALYETAEKIHGEVTNNLEERIDALEKVLLRDLKIMKHRQVIHPVLQEVGLKLNLLDLTLAIDLKYLGVCLPIPPPVLVPGGSSGNSTSSHIRFVSRTGKTTDFTKIKGWRDKFTNSGSSSFPGVSNSLDTGQKNLSAFCSDMLDEYLESEGKLIDERADSFSKAAISPVAYQLPTKSTSYVRTLDSVLKKQAPTTSTPIKPLLASKKPTLVSKSKSGENTSKKSSRSGATKTSTSTEKLLALSSSEASKLGSNLSKTTRCGMSKTSVSQSSAAFSLSQNKKPAKIKSKKGSKTSQASVDSIKQGSTFPGSSTAGGRIPGLPKTLVKLMDVEDGAVWEGKHRTCITEERAAIALSSLVTTEATMRGTPSTIIKRRAPPCLNDFCRLGCVCASLAQERRQHHCGKPQCMLGCDCLRRKVVLLKKPAKDESPKEGLAPKGQPTENGVKLKKKKRRKSYILSGSEAAPEPAARVRMLWDQKNGSDSEAVFIPTPARPHCPPLLSPELQEDLDNFLCPSPKKVMDSGGLSLSKNDKEKWLTCARVRPFGRRRLSHTGLRAIKEGDPHLCSQNSSQGLVPEPPPNHFVDFPVTEMEEGELRPPTLSGPSKRLEIVSKCKWATAGSRNIVLRVVCEHMAQDRLNHPFWIGKYRIQPISKTVQETEAGSTTTYKVVISQPQLVQNKVKKEEDERMKELEALLIKTIGKSEVKGLPLLSQVTPAGMLKAEKRPPGAPGQIWVNGKPYPQAKLELGQIGALHPANRLAAYITGRVYTAKQQASNLTPNISKTSTTNPTTTIASVATTTSVSDTIPATVVTAKPSVSKPSVGSVFTQVVLNHINSQQQKLPCTSTGLVQSTLKNLIIPTSSTTGATGSTLSPKTPSKADMAYQASTTSGSTDSSNTITKAVPGFATPKKTFVVSTAAQCAAQPADGVRLTQPIVSTRPPVPGQRMVFQMLKTANGNTLFRNPNGQIIQLVPLSQFRALNPNLLIPRQTTLIRLPTPSAVPLSKPVNASSASSTTTPSTPVTSTTQAQSLTTVPSTTNVTMTTAVTSSVASKPVASLSGSKDLTFSSQPSTVKIVPGFLRSTGTSTLRILPPKVVQDPKVVKDPKTTITTSVTSEQNGGFVLLTPQTTQCQDLQGSNSTAHSSSTLTGGPEQDSKCSNESPEKAVHADHSYTFETKASGSSPQMVEDAPKDGSDLANISASHMLLNEVLDLGPVETCERSGTASVVVATESGDGYKEEGEIDSDCTELTEDSDMYNDTESARSSDQEDMYIVNDSDEGEKNGTKQKTVSVDVEFQSLPEKDDDELVDIETLDERPEKSSALAEVKQQEGPSNHKAEVESGDELLGKCKRRTQERVRRSTLKECFHKLHRTLSSYNHKASKMMILTQAREEIDSLTTQRNRLVKAQNKLRKKRVHFLQIASQLTGKPQESISRKLDEIVAKQKALEGQNKVKSTNLDFIENFTDPSEMDLAIKMKDKMRDTTSRHAQLSTNSTPIDLSITKHKTVESQDKGIENDHVQQKTLDNGETQAVPRPCQPARRPNTPSAPHPTSHLKNCFPASRERTRPNILSRSKSQTPPVSPAKDQVVVPQVIPLVQTVVPYNQVITISNPLQPIGITSLGERQPTTPGVAAVSISVPAVSHPIRVENPLLQSQILKLANSPLKINTPVKTLSLPRISGVVSLVPPEKVVVPSSVVLQKADVKAANQGQAAFRLAVTEPLQSHSQAAVHPVEEELGTATQQAGAVPKRPGQGNKVNVADAATSQKEEAKNAASTNEPDDENLMSLLDELVFLNQQLNNESSQPEGGALSLKAARGVPADPLTEKEAGAHVDNERSLSPLFLRLEEDLIASTTSKDDEIDDIPPKVDDLVKVIFGSDSPPNSSESEATAVVCDEASSGPAGSSKRDAPSPPPLLQMKAGGVTIPNSSKEQASVSWRPMPKLAPLGLKTQEAGPPNAPSPLAARPGSKLPGVHSANVQ